MNCLMKENDEDDMMDECLHGWIDLVRHQKILYCIFLRSCLFNKQARRIHNIS